MRLGSLKSLRLLESGTSRPWRVPVALPVDDPDASRIVHNGSTPAKNLASQPAISRCKSSTRAFFNSSSRIFSSSVVSPSWLFCFARKSWPTAIVWHPPDHIHNPFFAGIRFRFTQIFVYGEPFQVSFDCLDAGFFCPWRVWSCACINRSDASRIVPNRSLPSILARWLCRPLQLLNERLLQTE